MAALAAPAAAQTTDQTPAVATDTSGTQVGELVVTGSRIKTTTYNSPDPLTVITAEQAQLTGEVDTSQILQLSAVAANAVQINNYFTGFVTTGGPGANTLSLRGLGADRTLILLNGERMGPAGVGGTVGPIDLNTIPASMVDHIDILKDGASSIYGSDAVAGVVNIITKTNQDGGDIHAFFNPSQGGGGNIYQVDASWGKTFDKGYIQAGFDFYQQDALHLSQRSYLNCSRDLARDATTGQNADIIDPATGMDKCWNEISGAVEDLESPSGFVVYRPDPSAVAGGGYYGSDLNGFQNVGLSIPGDTAATRLSRGLEPENSALYEENDAISPDSRYTFSLFAGYDINPHTHLYGSVLLNQRDSSQFLVDQFFVEPVVPDNPFNPGFNYPVPIIQQAAPASQTVDYGRFVIGLKGDLPFGNWTYDIFGQYSRSDGSYTQSFVRADRVSATAGAGAGTNGCDTSISYFSNESMDQLEPGVACVPVNYFAAVTNGGFTPAEYNFLYDNDEKGHTSYDQEYIEGSFTGDLFKLPAGELSAAVGFHFRREAIDDVPGIDFQDGNDYNFSSAGITKGAETVEEGFGEFKVPIIKNVPGVYSLDVDLSGRYSNYSDFGGQFTYKATVDWKVTDWLAGRATYGTAFRAPALYELYLADQTGFYGQAELDPCIDYATSGVSPVIQKNCASLGIPGNYTAANASSVLDSSGGGIGHLKAETSVAETFGFVLTPHWGDNQINLSVDYYTFDINNQIAQFGAANIITECYGATNFPNNPFCSLITRDLTPGDPSEYAITQVNDDYVNLNKETDQGIDVDLNYRTQLPKDVKFTFDAVLDWTTYTNTFLLGGATDNFLGTIGYPRFVGNLDFKFDRGPWTFNWEVYMIGHASDNPATATTIGNFRGTDETVTTDYVTPFYTNSDISIRRKFDKFTVIFGVKNVFNQTPPAISYDDSFEPHTIGTSPSAVSQYDLIGRSFYFDIDAKF
ncbi:MAG TPA: TonB-dependent receptor [Caulobacteraceae bacterium]|jgi:iron complex outermembrane receptor protein|nr:TonB-dependent receptor [Caulobacteraceae bacterium]